MALPFCFNDFSEEITFKCFQNLQGGREALPLMKVCRVWAEQLASCNDTMWKTFGAQEFGDTNLQAPPAPKHQTAALTGFTGVDRYASLARAASLKQALWGRVRTSGFGSREGTPWIFHGKTGEELFAYGGYGPRGPANDLMVAPLSELKKLLSVTSAGFGVVPEPVAATASAPSDPATFDDIGEGMPPTPSPDQQLQPDTVAPRLDFAPVHPRGRAPMPSYGATVTPLVDDELPGCSWLDLDVVKRCLHDPVAAQLLPEGAAAAQTTLFLVTGGYLQGGYRQESPDWSLGIIPPQTPVAPDASGKNGTSEEAPAPSFHPPQRAEQPKRSVIWVKPGPALLDGESPNCPTARSNASAVFVPARFTDSSRYPSGYVMVFGGNVNREASNSVDILDLSSFVWSRLNVLPQAPIARNSHSAVLMPDADEPESKAKVLVFGGANGGDVPRGGQDFQDFAMFDPRQMEWLGSAVTSQNVPGRAHVAVKIGRSVLFFGGGRIPTNKLSAVDCQMLSEQNGRVLAACANADIEGDAMDVCESDSAGMTELMRSMKWSDLKSCGNMSPASRAFHAAISLAPVGVPVLLIYGGWHPRRGNYGDIWAAKLDAWDTAKEGGGGVGQRARNADGRFVETLAVSAGQGPAQDDADSEDQEEDEQAAGPYVNIGGRILPLQMFARLVRAQMGDEEAERMLGSLQRRDVQATGEDEEDEDEDDEESEEERQAGEEEASGEAREIGE